MKERAARARKLRIEAANRLITHIHPKEEGKKPGKTKVRHLVPPTEVHIKVVPA